MFAVPVYPENRMEDLLGRVGVQRGDDFRYEMEIAVDEGAKPLVVLHRATAAPASHEEFELGETEGVLAVHQEQRGAAFIFDRGSDAVFRRPGAGIGRPFFVGDAPEGLDGFGPVVGRQFAGWSIAHRGCVPGPPARPPAKHRTASASRRGERCRSCRPWVLRAGNSV